MDAKESPKKRLVLLIILPFVLAVIGLVIYLKGGRYVSTENAHIKADVIPISSQVAGAVIERTVTENQAVKAGQLLFRIDDEPYKIALAKFSLTRNIGSSIGISVVISQLQQNIQKNHAAFADYLTPFSLPLKQAMQDGVWNIHTTQGLVALNGEVTRQAATLAYLQDFRLMMWITLSALPLIVFLKVPPVQAKKA